MTDTPPRVSIADPETARKRRRRQVWVFVALTAVVAVASLVMDTQKTQSPVWFGPYLSAAANLEPGAPLQIDLEEVRRFAAMSVPEREQYSFGKSADTVTYDYNDAGFAYFVAIGKVVFFWMSDQHAIEAFQIMIHALSCALIIVLLPGNLSKVLFFVVYAVNPFVVYFVTFPFYYFWQATPSIALVLMLLGRSIWSSARGAKLWVMEALIVISSVGLGITLAARPTTLFVIILVVVTSFWLLEGRRRAVQVALIVAAVAFLIRVPSERNFWHTAYIGIGAWSNGHGIDNLSDDEGYALFAQRTGDEISASLGGNMYDPDIMVRYREVARSEYLRIAEENPSVLIRNAILNTLQAYSLGYLNMVGSMTPAFRLTNYLSALVGLGILLLLLLTRRFLLFFAVGLSVGTFSLYFPPIPAYMFGAYLLLVIGVIAAMEDMWTRRFERPQRSSEFPHRLPLNRVDRASTRTLWRRRPDARV